MVALLARLGLVVAVLLGHPGRRSDVLFWTADTERYLDLAASLLHGRFATAEGPEILRLPGYPLLLSPGVWLGWPTAVALLSQAMLCALLVAMVVRMARLIGLADRAAAAAGYLCAVEPTLLLWSLHLMAEAPLAVVVTATLWALLTFLEDGSRRALVGATVLAALAAFVKVVAYGFVAVVSLTVAGAAFSRGARKALRLLAVTAIGGGLILGSWHARNVSVAGFAGFSTQMGQVNRHGAFAAWRAAHPEVSAAEARLEFQRRVVRPSPSGGLPTLDVPFLSRVRTHLVGSWWTVSSPGVITWLQFLGLEARGMAATRDLVRNGRWHFLLLSVQDRPHVVFGSILLTGLNLLYWTLFAVGLLRMSRQSRAISGAVLLLVLYFALAAGGPWGQSRFRAPFVGALCLVAGAAFDRRNPSRRPGGIGEKLDGLTLNPRTEGGLPHGH